MPKSGHTKILYPNQIRCCQHCWQIFLGQMALKRSLTSNNTDCRDFPTHRVNLCATTALARKGADKPASVDRGGGAGQVDVRCGEQEGPGGHTQVHLALSVANSSPCTSGRPYSGPPFIQEDTGFNWTAA